MRTRIRDVLLVSSRYDSYLFEEDGRLYELIRNEYQGLSLSHAPELTSVSDGEEALLLAKEEGKFDLIIATLHLEAMHPLQFARKARELGIHIPIVLLAFDNRELSELMARHDTSAFDRIFVWQGDYRLVIAIIKYFEDRLNVAHDTRLVGVQSIILIEDNIRFYSSYLPLIYTEILKQSQRLISEGINLSHRFLRMSARPKILLFTNYDEAWSFFIEYRENILGVISDIDFQRGGKPDPEAGLEFARNVKARMSDIPILLQSNSPENRSKALQAGASFVLKDSPTLLDDVRRFMNEYFSFGDFVFKAPDGTEVGRAHDLISLEEQLRIVPEESLKFHGERNHFSNWLKARTEFWLAHQLRPRRVSDYQSFADLRSDLISSLQQYRRLRQRGMITDFTGKSFDPERGFARIGGGSLGGKARGLGFLNTLINDYDVEDRFKNLRVYVPPGIVIATDAFDEFLADNDLRNFAFDCSDDNLLTQKFLAARKFPKKIVRELSEFLEKMREPLAVRSSSLLEDSQYQPFAGVYETYMIPNDHRSRSVRLGQLIDTIKRVYASTFYQKAKNYIRATSYRLEEEKMAVIIQKMVGSRHHTRFYPDFAGVAKSHNFYPSPPQKPSDGVAAVALGLGKMVVDGGPSVRFCPKFPGHASQLSSIQDTLANNQHEFFALDLSAAYVASSTYDTSTRTFDLKTAEEDGTLSLLGSTFSPENDAVYDGISRTGMRLVTFAPILKGKVLQLPEVLTLLLEIGSGGMGSPVELEFAVNVPPAPTREFGVLQMRPLAVSQEIEGFTAEDISREQIFCESPQVLGNGIIDDVCDIIYVDGQRFDRAKSVEVAAEVGQFNSQLAAEERPYILIGVGRWGTLDPWLGIPVRWDQISGAKAIVESGFAGFSIAPSQGSHFFQNLTAFKVGYFTVDTMRNEGFLDWDWLRNQTPVEQKSYARHLRFNKPAIVRMNGHKNQGVILKPGPTS